MEGIAQHILYSFQAHMQDDELQNGLFSKQKQPKLKKAKTLQQDNPFVESLCTQAYFTPTSEMSLDKKFSFDYPRNQLHSLDNSVAFESDPGNLNNSLAGSETPSSLSENQFASSSVDE